MIGPANLVFFKKKMAAYESVCYAIVFAVYVSLLSYCSDDFFRKQEGLPPIGYVFIFKFKLT